MEINNQLTTNTHYYIMIDENCVADIVKKAFYRFINNNASNNNIVIGHQVKGWILFPRIIRIIAGWSKKTTENIHKFKDDIEEMIQNW